MKFIHSPSMVTPLAKFDLLRLIFYILKYRARPAAALFGALLGALPVESATVTWVGTAGDSYTNKAAWSTANLPGLADTASVGNGSIVYTNTPPDPASTNATSQLFLGNVASTTSTFIMNSGTLSLTNAGNTFLLGNAASASGTFTQNGGVLNVLRNASTFFQDSFQLGLANGSSGTFTLNSGQANFICGIEVGISGTGTINVNGGTFVDNGWFGIARGGSSAGIGNFNLSGGTVYLLRNPGNDGALNGISFCQGGTNGNVNISGGALYVNAIRFEAGGAAGRTDWETFTMSGGDLYLSGGGVVNVASAGTHNLAILLSGGTWHTIFLGPNTGGTQGTNSVGPAGTNWTWAATLPATLNNSPGPGTVTFAPDAGHTITLNNQFSGPGALAMTGPGTLVFNNAGNSYTGGTTISGGTVTGAGLVPDPVSVSSAATLAPGTASIPGTLSSGALTLNGDTNIIKLSGDPTQAGNGINDLIQVFGNLSLQGVSTIKIVPLGPLSTTAAYTVLTYAGTPLTAADTAHLQIVSDSPRYTFAVVDPSTTPGAIMVSVSGNAANLLWKGGVAGNLTSWDHTTTNWFNLDSSKLDTFFNGDVTIFDDTATTNRATILGTEQPISMIMSNNSTAYTVNGGALAATLLDMEGTAPLTLASTNAPAITSITNNSGTLVLNVQGLSSYALAANISDNGNALGTLVQAATNTVILGGNNVGYTGTIVVTNGVLQYSNAASLGVTQWPLYATNGGTLDVAGVVSGLKNIHIAGTGFNGQGAINNSSTISLVNNNGVNNITMDGDASVGALSRWDSYQNSFGGNGHTLTGVGPGSVLLIDDQDIGIGDLHIVAGRIGFQGQVNMGDPTKTCTVESNATLTFFAAVNPFTGNHGEDKIVVLKGGAVFDSGGNAGDSNVFNGPIFMRGTNLIGTRRALYITNSISDTNGSGGFLLGSDSVGASAEDLYLQGPNTYTGPTIITNRTLFVGASSSLGSSSLILTVTPGALNVTALPLLGLGAGQTLAGNGAVSANSVVIGSNARLIAGLGGNDTTALTINGNLTLQAGSSNIFAVNKTTSVANSRVAGVANAGLGGALVLNLSGNALASGDAISLFNASGVYSGGFDSISPSTPGPNLLWNTNTLTTDGTLRVAASVNTSPTNMTLSVSGGSLTLTWPSDHTGWTLQTQTNTLLSTWFDVPGSASTNSVTIPIDPANNAAFYRLILH